MTRRIGIDWNRVTGLGEQPDSIIAQRLHCSRENVQKRRVEHGIPSYADNHKADGERVCPECGKVFHRIPSIDTLFCSSICRGRGLSHRNPKARKYLGTIADGQVAERFAMSKSTVVSWRHDLGIEFHRWGRIPYGFLGAMPDSELSDLTGVAVQSICKMRLYYRIPPVKYTRYCLICGLEFEPHLRNQKVCKACRCEWELPIKIAGFGYLSRQTLPDDLRLMLINLRTIMRRIRHHD